MSAEVQESGGKRGKSKQKKMTVRVDFTPMVDMNMLLITFFMLCTTLSKPQTMEISMPSNDKNITEEQKSMVKASQAITLLLGPDNKLYYYEGEPNYKDYTSLKETTYGPDGLRSILLQKNATAVNKVRALKQQKLDLKISDEEYKKQVSEIKSGKDTPTVIIKATDDASYMNLIDALDEMGLRENAIVIFNSDHGEMLGDHGLTHKGCRFYEGITHVPLIISLPGTFRQNAVYGGLVEQTDLAPTIADLCGIPPADTHGRSLVPVLTGQNAPAPRKFVRAEFYDTLEVDMNYDGLRAPGEIQAAGKPAESCYATMYYDGRFKLSVYHGIQFGELYDMENDPQEQHNLWYDKDHQDVKQALILDSFGVSTKYSRPGQTRRGRY